MKQIKLDQLTKGTRTVTASLIFMEGENAVAENFNITILQYSTINIERINHELRVVAEQAKGEQADLGTKNLLAEKLARIVVSIEGVTDANGDPAKLTADDYRAFDLPNLLSINDAIENFASKPNPMQSV